MLSGENIVCIAFPRWEGDYMKSTVELMAELAVHNKVLYVDYPYTIKDLLTGWAKKEPVPSGRMLGFRPALQQKKLANGAMLHLLALPPFIPANWLSSARAYDNLLQWNGRLAAGRIRRAIRQLGMKAPIVINAFNPAVGNVLAGKLGEKLLAYYCYDEISAAAWASKHGARHEQAFLKRAGLTIVSSAQLLREKSKAAPHCALVKNGVGRNFFQPPGPRPEDLPPPGSQPLIGYLGSVDERLDFGLLAYLAQAMPHCRFIFVGRIIDKEGAERLKRLPNVSLLGSRPPQQLPAYLSAFRLGLIPFVKNRLTAGIYPLKANEYLALGKPIVATEFADLSDFEGAIYTASTYEGFRQGIEAALAEGEQYPLREARCQMALHNSWEQRAAEFGSLLEKAIAPHTTEKQYF